MPQTIHNMATVAAATVSGSVAEARVIREMQNVRAFLRVTAASGTSPTLDVTLGVTVNGQRYVIGTFAQLTAAGSEMISISDCPSDLDVDYVITGTTPSFDFTVDIMSEGDA